MKRIDYHNPQQVQGVIESLVERNAELEFACIEMRKQIEDVKQYEQASAVANARADVAVAQIEYYKRRTREIEHELQSIIAQQRKELAHLNKLYATAQRAATIAEIKESEVAA